MHALSALNRIVIAGNDEKKLAAHMLKIQHCNAVQHVIDIIKDHKHDRDVVRESVLLLAALSVNEGSHYTMGETGTIAYLVELLKSVDTQTFVASAMALANIAAFYQSDIAAMMNQGYPSIFYRRDIGRLMKAAIMRPLIRNLVYSASNQKEVSGYPISRQTTRQEATTCLVHQISTMKTGREAILAANGIEPLVAFIKDHRNDQYTFFAIQTLANLALDDTCHSKIKRVYGDELLRWYVKHGVRVLAHEAEIALERLGAL